jgi:hypothetical protein
MMNIEPPWWWVILFLILIIPILPFMIVNKLTKDKIKPLNWLVEFYIENTVERWLM